MATKIKSEAERDAERKRKSRAAARTVSVPKCADAARRKRLEGDDCEWLLYYFAPESGTESPFTYKFTSQQTEMIGAIRQAILNGDDQAMAASRGEGKTTICERMILKYTLQGLIKFAVLFAATGGAAEDSLTSIKIEIENNVRLTEDYPEVCMPVQALEGIAQKANSQLVEGKRHDNGKPYKSHPSRFSWCGQEVFFPTIPGSPSTGAIIATRGLDAAVRGLKKKGRRVDVAVIDDPDTEDSARSEEQAKKLDRRIDRAIGGLGSQTKPVARVMLTTLQSRICVSYRYTDPKEKPSWKGRRFRFLIQPPTNLDLWQQYIELQKHDWDAGTIAAREFYFGRRAEMDAGAVVANPNRHTPAELSALQHYYNEIAKKGPEYAATELDNDPPEETGIITSGLTKELIQRQVNGFPRGVIPDGAILLTHNCDVGKLKGFHWAVTAWMPDGTGHVIDYNIMGVQGAKHGSDEGLERAIMAAVLRRADEFKARRYTFANGQPLENVISTYDARYKMDAVLSGVSRCGMDVYGIVGIGRSAGCIKGTFRDVVESSGTRRKLKHTTGAYEELHVGPYGKIWAIHGHADKWKTSVHERWLTAQDRPGCLFLFGDKSDTPGKLSSDERAHEEFGKHICSEMEYQDGQERKWPKEPRGDNDFLDVMWHACCSAAVRGIKVLSVEAKKRLKPSERPSPDDLAARSARL